MADELEGRYHILNEMARGGAARVFQGRSSDGTPVAVKVLHPQLAVSVEAKRFLQEVDFLRQIKHPRIARLIDFGKTDLIVFYVMEYVRGPNLREHLEQARRATLDDTMRIADDLLDALEYAHGEGIVHRDVKPENIVLSRSGPVLIDFGIARAVARAGTDRLTRSGFVVGTSTYMSPEQVEGLEDIDHRSDIYSLGCVLYECLAGRPPFVAKRDEAVLRLHLEGTPPALDDFRQGIPEHFRRAINVAMQRPREQRWQSARDMREAIAVRAG